MKKLIVNEKYDGKKLNKFLLDNIENLSSNLLYKTLRKKDIKINGKRVSENVLIHLGDEVLVYISDDLLDGYSWHKSEKPVFKSSEKNQQFGPGHNSFTVSEDGKKDLLVYPARPEKNKSGDPLANPNRHARIQSFEWGADGLPIFGEPVAD